MNTQCTLRSRKGALLLALLVFGASLALSTTDDGVVPEAEFLSEHADCGRDCQELKQIEADDAKLKVFRNRNTPTAKTARGISKADADMKAAEAQEMVEENIEIQARAAAKVTAKAAAQAKDKAAAAATARARVQALAAAKVAAAAKAAADAKARAAAKAAADKIAAVDAKEKAAAKAAAIVKAAAQAKAAVAEKKLMTTSSGILAMAQADMAASAHATERTAAKAQVSGHKNGEEVALQRDDDGYAAAAAQEAKEAHAAADKARHVEVARLVLAKQADVQLAKDEVKRHAEEAAEALRDAEAAVHAQYLMTVTESVDAFNHVGESADMRGMPRMEVEEVDKHDY